MWVDDTEVSMAANSPRNIHSFAIFQMDGLLWA